MRFLTRRLFHIHQDLIVLGLLLFLSLLLIALDHTPWMERIKGTAKECISFPEKITGWVPEALKLHKENRALKYELGKLNLLKHRFETVNRENQRLRKMLEFNLTEYRVIPAEIVGRGSAGLPGSIHLDAGSRSGCRKNMVLMTDRGVVGKLVSVGTETSVGQLIADPNFRISARVERSGVLGIVQWVYGNICQMALSRRSDVLPGDTILTSGFSRIYPSGLTIGTVSEVIADRNNLFTRAMIRTSVNLDAISEVFIVSPDSLGSRPLGDGR